MATTGTVDVDFGAFPGKSDASVDVTGQGAIIAGSQVEAWIRGVATTDHSADEAVFDGPRLVAAKIVAGVGFTIYAFAPSDGMDRSIDAKLMNRGDNAPVLYGKYTVNWVWN